MSDYGGHPALRPARVERTDVPVRFVAALIALAGVTLVLVAWFVAALFPRARIDQPIRGLLRPPPAPRLQASPRADMEAFQADQLRRLGGVWWVDRVHGVVHQPIEDAMRALARQGIADWPVTPVDPAPRDPILRHGTQPAGTVFRGPQAVPAAEGGGG